MRSRLPTAWQWLYRNGFLSEGAAELSFDLDDNIKERIRESIDIVELAGQYVTLRRAGSNYVGRCPWHEDSRPSLQINPSRQTFKCWVCDIGGDVFSFIMKIENVPFREALELLADKAGITLPRQKHDVIRLKSSPAAKKSHGENDGAAENEPAREITKQVLYQAADWLAQQYHEVLLNSDEAVFARQYLSGRGIDDELIRQFCIGYAPLERDWILDKIKYDPVRIEILELIGNLIQRTPSGDNDSEVLTSKTSTGYTAPKTLLSPRSNSYFDRFRGRVLFPIRDTQDRTVAFGGRVIPNAAMQSPAKYLNSPETPLFSKHRMLYGLDLARHKMKETRRAIIMEGYTDCIIARKYGFCDSVAVLGTALGSEHIRILKRFVDKMVLVLDGDEAGRKRAAQVLELFVSQGVDVSILTLPSGLDPCDFLEEHGADAF
ncbi:MAG: DNA primase, partial [Thermoguttaceae bacterium]